MVDNAKKFHAMLTGIIRRVYYNEQDFTVPFFMENVFGGDASEEDVTSLHETCTTILTKCGELDLPPPKVEEVLGRSHLSEIQKEVLLHFWVNNKAKVHDRISTLSNMNNSLHSFDWRIDMKMASKSDQETGATAIVQLKLQEPSHKAGEEDPSLQSVCFEMDRGQLDMVLLQINSINEAITEYTK
mmetsp:Transcript_10734/g.30135  ORF Transcript_10734/g.30135 Transcript_10734/m.30135 type:complete len:186 (+) Transcript_10734:28-585(+)